MLKALLSCLIILSSIILLSNSVYATSPENFITVHQDSLIYLCEDGYGEMGTAILFECMITEFYGLHQVTNILMVIERSGKDWDFFVSLFEKYKRALHGTYDFMAIHLDFEEYLEKKEGKGKIDSINKIDSIDEYRKGEGL